MNRPTGMQTSNLRIVGTTRSCPGVVHTPVTLKWRRVKDVLVDSCIDNCFANTNVVLLYQIRRTRNEFVIAAVHHAKTALRYFKYCTPCSFLLA